MLTDSRLLKTALCAWLVMAPCAATAEIAAGSGSFVVPGGAGRESRVIEVHYHRPQNLTAGSPVVMVMPGAGRNGDDYRDAWIDAAERHGVLVLSPSYTEAHYPAYWSYNLGNMASSVTVGIRLKIDTDPERWRFSEAAQDAHGNPLLRQLVQLDHAGMLADLDAKATGLTVNQDRGDWIYPDFDRIFEAARDALELDAQTYDLFGHSAGGQVLHRFALFHPASRANRILAANSGWYTLPDFEVPFPYGLEGTGMEAAEIREALQSRLVVFLGELDDENETRGSLRETPEADRQGPGRLERGRYFFARAQALAQRLDAELAWRLEVVPGVGHEYRRMADAAAEYLYEETRSTISP